MNREVSEALQKLLGRDLESAERDRLERIQDALNLGPNDSLWAIIAALEFQRTYYEKLPEKIRQESAKVCSNISEMAEKEVANAQAQLAESVVAQAEKLSQVIHIKTWLMWGGLVLFLLAFFGCLNMWAGYCIGTGKTQPMLLILHMPVGILLGGIGMIGGMACGIFAAVKRIEIGQKAHWLFIAAVSVFMVGGILFSLSM